MTTVLFTTLMKVEKPNVASFVIAHPHIWTASTTFVNPRIFGNPGDMLVVGFKVSGSRRFLTSCQSFAGTPVDFVNSHKHTLEAQDIAFKIRFPAEAKSYMDRGLSTNVGMAAPTTPTTKPIAKPRSDEDDASDSLDGGLWVEGIYMNRSDYRIFNAMLSLTEIDTANILLVGPSGCGKTSIPEAIAKLNGMKFLRMNCATVRDPEEWFGYREAKDGSTIFVPTEFTTAVEDGNVIVVLDEFNRIEPWLHNSLLPLLDHGRRTTVHGHEIARGSNVLFVATINRGSRFTGTFMLDAAILNRFSATIYASYLPAELETELLINRTGIEKDQARKIVKIMANLREFMVRNEADIDVSTRSSLKVASILSTGKLPVEFVFKYVILNLIEDEGILKGAVDIIKVG